MCEFSTLRKGNLTAHIKSIHLKEKKFDCISCDYKAATKGHLHKHFDSVHQKNIITCQICNKRLKKTSFARHMKTFHGDQKSLHSCKMCPFQTIHHGSLQIHTENVHKKPKKHKI